MTKLADLLKRCEHGDKDAHCDEHPGQGSHFGVATHKGGCRGASFVLLDDLRSVLADPETQEMLGARTVEPLGWPSDPDDFIEDGNYLVVPLSNLEDTE